MKRSRLAAIVGVVCCALALIGCGGDSSGDGQTQGHDDNPVAEIEPASDSPYRGGQVVPLEPAPAIDLRDVDGKPVRIADLTGKVVLVTFVYTQCPDICQLIVESLNAAKRELGDDGDDVELIAVSVDPEGDTPARVREFLRRHNVEGSLRYVIGRRNQLEPLWAAWGIAAQQDFDDPHLVEHSGVIWVLNRSGQRAVFFPLSSITVDDVVNDVRLLLDEEQGGS